jgi:hypothetical protein
MADKFAITGASTGIANAGKRKSAETELQRPERCGAGSANALHLSCPVRQASNLTATA